MTRLPDHIQRFDLIVRVPPAKAWYAGRQLQLPTASVRLLRRLLCFDIVSTDEMVDEVHHRAGAEAVRVALSKLRAELRRQLVPITINHERNIGYSLEWRAPAEHVPAWLRRLRRRLNPHRDHSNPWRVKDISECSAQ